MKLTIRTAAMAVAFAMAGCAGESQKETKQQPSRGKMNGGKPIIGINANYSSPKETETPAISVRATYVDAVVKAGGIPIVLPPVADESLIDQQVASCDGFIFIGGADINPARYGADPHPTTSLLSERRENYDFALIRKVMDEKKPFLGVCLGCQQINVAMGGTLIQDIASETSSTIPHSMKQTPYLRVHEVEVEPGTMLADIVNTRTLVTNSAHHQAVGEPGPGVIVSARSPEDGIIEALEVAGYGFGLAVQWHPEYLVEEPEHLGLFKGLVNAAAGATIAAGKEN